MKAVKYTDVDLTRVRALYRHGGGDDEAFAQLLADEREFAAQQCDAVAKGPSRTPAEKGVARQLAKRIREGRP